MRRKRTRRWEDEVKVEGLRGMLFSLFIKSTSLAAMRFFFSTVMEPINRNKGSVYGFYL